VKSDWSRAVRKCVSTKLRKETGNMADCERSNCRKRFYSFAMLNGVYQITLTEYSDPPTPKGASLDWPKRSPVAGIAKRKTDDAEAAVKAALKKLEDEGETLEECKSPCRCPKIDKPPLGKDPWPEEDDEVTMHTPFTTGRENLVIWYKIKQKTCERTRGCILEDKATSPFPGE
jgi:hypothetical protein